MKILDVVLNKIKLPHILFLSAALYLFALNARLTTGGDDSSYILLSRLILEKGIVNYIAWCFKTSVVAMVFILPLLLLPFTALAPENFLLMKAISLVSALLSIIVLNELLKYSLNDRYRKIALVLFAFNPWIVEYSGLISTDMVFLFFSLSTLLFIEKYAEKGKVAFLFLSAFFMVLSFLTRLFGLALIPAVLITLGLRKKWKSFAFLTIIVSMVILPVLYYALPVLSATVNSFMIKQKYYALYSPDASFPKVLYRMGYNLCVYAGNYLPDIIFKPLVLKINPRLSAGVINSVFFFKFILGISFSFIVLSGFLKGVREKVRAYHVYFIFYLIFALVINVYVARYMLSLIPLIILFFLKGLPESRQTRATGRLGSFLICVLLLVAAVGSAVEAVKGHHGYLPAESRSFVECNDWVKANASKDAIILSRKPTFTRLYTGRNSVAYIFSDNPDEQFSYFMSSQASYVIIGEVGFSLGSEKSLLGMIYKYKEKFELAFSTKFEPKNYVYKSRFK